MSQLQRLVTGKPSSPRELFNVHGVLGSSVAEWVRTVRGQTWQAHQGPEWLPQTSQAQKPLS